MHTLINIGRSFGSGGGFVGHAIGEKLGIPFYDNERICQAAEQSGYSRNILSGEQKSSLFNISSFFVSGRPGFLEGNYATDNVLFEVQSAVIRDIAAKGDAILIGRCADYIIDFGRRAGRIR